MRASPPLLFQLDSFRVWRIASALLCTLAAATLVAWAATAPESRRLPAGVLTALGVIGIGFIARWLWTVPTRPTQLFWDGINWHVSVEDLSRQVTTGRIDIAIDAGAWMLLLFTPDAEARTGRSRRSIRWLPAERRSSIADWHALRYTLHGNARRLRATATSVPGTRV